MIKDYLDLAFGSLKHRGLRSWLTLLGIFIGIAAVVSLISLGDGLREAVNSQFGISTTNVISIQAGGLTGYGPPGSGVVKPLTVKDADAIKNLNNVEIVITRNIRTVKIEFNKKLLVGFSASMPDDKKKLDYVYKTLELEMLSGNLLQSTDSGKVLLGYNFQDENANGFDKPITVGDTIQLNGQNFKVEGISKRKGSFIFDNIVYVMDPDLKNLLDYGDDVDVIVAVIKDKDLINQTKTDIENLLRKRRDVDKGSEDFEVSTPEAALGTVNQILLGVQIFIVLIASISIIVGCVGIVNTMTTSVLERTKEIGIMKSIGARNRDIFFQFFIEAGLLGLIGGIAGATVGTLIGYFGTIALNNFIGSTVSPSINFFLIFSALLGSFLIGAVSGIVPALNASKLNPVQALRG